MSLDKEPIKTAGSTVATAIGRPAPDMSAVAALGAKVRASVERVMVGKGAEIELMLVAMLCEGHVLLEDVPGIGKTTMAKALARSLGCTFQRIQFTPDLLPSDITGTSIYNQQAGKFEMRKGPIFAQIVLTDEINRAGPRTQSALLEAMEERQVTIDVDTIPLPRPFMVLATQNPVELEGTFPLPEAQLDRFLIKLTLGYPKEDEERTILRRFREESPMLSLEPAADAGEILQVQRAIRNVYVSPAVESYLLAVIQATRRHETIELGASPRATLALYRAVQALAALNSRGFALPDDVKRLVGPVLGHRLLLSTRTRLRGRNTDAILQEVVDGIPVPAESLS